MATSKKPKSGKLPNYQLDKRADALLQHFMEQGPDEDLSPRQVAEWFGVSIQLLDALRGRGEGPEYDKPGTRCITYTRNNCRKWLRGRAEEYKRRRRQKLEKIKQKRRAKKQRAVEHARP
jgi:hypothetical protein